MGGEGEDAFYQQLTEVLGKSLPLFVFLSVNKWGSGWDDLPSPFQLYCSVVYIRESRMRWKDPGILVQVLPQALLSPAMESREQIHSLPWISALEESPSWGMLEDQGTQRLPGTDFLSALMSQVTRQFYRGRNEMHLLCGNERERLKPEKPQGPSAAF